MRLVERAKKAFSSFSTVDQQTTDLAVTALAWSVYRRENAELLAALAVAETGMGNVPDKTEKNRNKTFGTLRDLLRAKSVGIIEELPHLGLTKFAKPVGIVCAVTPSTNPVATVVNKAMMAVKGRNAIVFSPSPASLASSTRTVELMRQELEGIALPADLVQILPPPITRVSTAVLMRSCDLVVVTGSQSNVRDAYRSGTPAIGVGAGNVPVILDASANIADACAKIVRSKIFDNSTSCSSENSLIIVGGIYDATLEILHELGGYLVTEEGKQLIRQKLWIGGKLNRSLLGRSAHVIATQIGLDQPASRARFLMIEESGVGPSHPFSDEKLSPLLTIYRATDFAGAVSIAKRILNYKGRGHSAGIHTADLEHARVLAEELDVGRLLINQSHAFANGGGFQSGLNFTLSMGCGTWQGNSICENLSWKNFVNITHMSVEIAEDRPSEAALFSHYWKKIGLT